MWSASAWAAGPPHEVEIELLARNFEALGMQRADRRSLGRGVDEIVESIDQSTNPALAAEEIERSLRSGGHSESYRRSATASWP